MANKQNKKIKDISNHTHTLLGKKVELHLGVA